MLVNVGAVFSLLVLVHFVVDWLFQSHDEAMKKSHDWRVRSRHCTIYALGFVPFMLIANLVGDTHFSLLEALLSLLILYVSHMVEDTYYPVFLWVKYVRKPPEFKTYSDDKTAFLVWFSKPLGKIIGIVVDQLIHILFLLPIAIFATV